MKQAFAILFALTLVWGQPLAAGIACCTAGAEPCCSCGGKMKCCVTQSSNSSQENPAVPASTIAQKDFQAALWLAVRLTAPVTGNDSRVAATSASVASARAVPLFARDCAYLL